MHHPRLFRALATLTASLVLLAGCGGGGGDGGTGDLGSQPEYIQPTTELGSSRQYENVCTLEGQKKFARSYLDEVYLWYDEIPAVDAARYDNIPDYFNALRVRTLDANGLPRDRFSTVLPSSQAEDLRQSYGLPQSDGQAVLKNHTRHVPIAKVVTSPAGRRVGYILFNDHDVGAQDDLIAAFRQVQQAGAQDLVLDLRNNSGGYLYIALAAASMITGPQVDGQVFEQLQYNAKRPRATADSTLRFGGTVQFAESQNAAGTPLPRLGLQRVFILASPQTCSSSESIINGLRGVDVQVIRIGGSRLNDAGVAGTCGKPYGFRQKNNCGFSYYPIEFKGANAKGFGDYTAGFQHTCQVAESGTPGAADDSLLNGALTYVDTGACPANTATGVQSAATPLQAPVEQPNRPSWAGRLLLPQQQAR